MATAMISEHIPDLDLITGYAERQNSLFSRVSPWTKFFMLILIVLMITLTRSLVILATLYGLILLVYGLGGLPVKKLFQWYTMPWSLSSPLSAFWRGQNPRIPRLPFSPPRCSPSS